MCIQQYCMCMVLFHLQVVVWTPACSFRHVFGGIHADRTRGRTAGRRTLLERRTNDALEFSLLNIKKKKQKKMSNPAGQLREGCYSRFTGFLVVISDPLTNSNQKTPPHTTLSTTTGHTNSSQTWSVRSNALRLATAILVGVGFGCAEMLPAVCCC